MCVVLADEGLDGIPQLILGWKAGSAERLALQQTEYDLNLVETAGRSRCEVKPDEAFEFGQPIIVFLMR